MACCYDILLQGCGSAIRFRDCSTKKKIEKLALSSLSPGHVSAHRSHRYITQRNTKVLLCLLHEMYNPSSLPMLLIWIWILAFCPMVYATPFLSCSIAWTWSSHWHWWFHCAVACPASRDIDDQVTAWKFRCPFSPYSVSPRQGTYWETNVCAGRIVLCLTIG